METLAIVMASGGPVMGPATAAQVAVAGGTSAALASAPFVAASTISTGMLLSGGFSLVSGFMQMQSQRALGAAQGAQAELQARGAAISAKQETLRGQQEANAIKRRTVELLARNNAAAAASGVDISSGSIQSVQDAVLMQADRQLDVSRSNADLARLSDEITGASLESDAEYYRRSGSRSGYASLFESATDAFGRYS